MYREDYCKLTTLREPRVIILHRGRGHQKLKFKTNVYRIYKDFISLYFEGLHTEIPLAPSHVPGKGFPADHVEAASSGGK